MSAYVVEDGMPSLQMTRGITQLRHQCRQNPEKAVASCPVVNRMGSQCPDPGVSLRLQLVASPHMLPTDLILDLLAVHCGGIEHV